MTIVLFGDSLSEGTYSDNWVKKLEKKINHKIENYAVNGATSSVVRHKLVDIDDLAPISSNPLAVVILVGGNDLISCTHPETGNMYVDMFPEILNAPPSIELYKKEMNNIVNILDDCLCKSTQVLILSAPPVGEGGPDSIEWETGLQFSEICRDAVLKAVFNGSDRFHFRDLYSMVRFEMQEKKCNRNLKLSLWKMTRNRILSYVLSWESIRHLSGFKYSHDGIHFCKEFGDLCTTIVTNWFYDTIYRYEE
tara:strand:- start:7 stop:759 length:753 start_codon:yes stop_codon:yes gene_type:complete